MRYYAAFMILLSTLAGSIRAQTGGGSVNTESVDLFFEVAQKLMDGEHVSPQQWTSLLSSPGYAVLSDHFGENFVRDCIELAYNDNFRQQRSRILADTVDKDNMFVAFVVSNLLDMRDVWDDLKEFKNSFDFDGLKSNSVRYLKDFLVEPVDSLVQFPAVNFLCFDKNGRKLDMGITIDLNLAFS